jgi:hypothetical protein
MQRKPITDHDEIRRWATVTQAIPVEVNPRKFDGQPAILRFVFGEVPKGQHEMREISWDSFFAQFDLLGLALVFNEDRQYELVQIEERSAYRFQGKPI